MDAYRTWRINPKTWLGLLALAVTLYVIIDYSGLISDILWVLFAASMVTLAIGPLATLLHRWHIPRGVTVVVVYLAAIAIIVYMGDLMVGLVTAEYQRLAEEGTSLINAISSFISSIPLLNKLIPSPSTLVTDIAGQISGVLGTVVGTLSRISNLALDTFIALILAYFFIVAGDLTQSFLTLWVPTQYRRRVGLILEGMRYRLTRWVWAQAAIALYFAVAYSVGLTLLGVPFGLTIGVIAGVLELIPYVGGIIGLVLATLSALTVAPILVLWVWIFHSVVVELEAHIVAPTFYGQVMNLPTSAVLVALLIGLKAKGIIGVLFAVPVAVVVAALIRELRENVVPDGKAPPTGEKNKS